MRSTYVGQILIRVYLLKLSFIHKEIIYQYRPIKPKLSSCVTHVLKDLIYVDMCVCITRSRVLILWLAKGFL